jgi:hypothetical protein
MRFRRAEPGESFADDAPPCSLVVMEVSALAPPSLAKAGPPPAPQAEAPRAKRLPLHPP